MTSFNAEATNKHNSITRDLANRANAQLSTGPRSEEGKARSSRNAVVHGLTGRTVLLPSEDARAYETHICRFFAEFLPETERERELVQALADTQWRLNRIPGLEFAVYASGRIQYAHLFKNEDPEVRPHLIDHHTLTVHARQLNNLSIQESRLRRNYKSDLAEFKQMQGERREREKAEKAKKAAQDAEAKAEVKVAPALAATASASLAAKDNGFVFSSETSNAPETVLTAAYAPETARELAKTAA